MLEFLGRGLGEPSLHKEGSPNLPCIRITPAAFRRDCCDSLVAPGTRSSSDRISHATSLPGPVQHLCDIFLRLFKLLFHVRLDLPTQGLNLLLALGKYCLDLRRLILREIQSAAYAIGYSLGASSGCWMA